MSDPKLQSIIDIDDEVQENLSKTPTFTRKTSKLPALPVNFDQSIFPKLASLIRKSTTPVHKNQPIEIIESNSLPDSKIEPLRNDGLQNQALEVTHFDPKLQNSQIIQKTLTLEPEQTNVYSDPTRIQLLPLHPKNDDCIQVETDDRERNDQILPQEITIPSESIEVTQLVNVSQQIGQQVDHTNKPEENLLTDKQGCQIQVPEDNCQKEQMQVQTLQKSKNIQTISSPAQENAINSTSGPNESAQNHNFQLPIQFPQKNMNPQIEQKQMNRDEIQSMDVQKPESEGHSSFGVIENSNILLSYGVNNASSDLDISIIPIENRLPLNEPLHILQEQNIEQGQTNLKNSQSQINPIPQAIHQDQPHLDRQVEIKPVVIDQMKQTPSVLSTDDITAIKQKISQYIPDLAAKINETADEQILQIYQLIIKDLNLDLCINDLPPQITENILKQTIAEEHSKKEGNSILQNISDNIIRMGQLESNSVQKQSTDPAQQLSKLRNYEEKELRTKMIEYFPNSKEMLTEMTFQDLQKMVDQSLEQLTKASKQPPIEQNRMEEEVPQQIVNKEIELLAQTEIVTHLANLQQQQPSKQRQQRSNGIIPPLHQLKASLIQKLPQLATQICQISNDNMNQIVHNHHSQINSVLNQTEMEQNQTILKPPATLDQPNIKDIIQNCIKLYPDLAGSIKQLDQSYIKEFYQSIVMKIGTPILASQPTQTTQPQHNQSDSDKKASSIRQSEKGSGKDDQSQGKNVEKMDPSNEINLKRTHEEMISTNLNLRREDDGERTEIKKKYTPKEIRTILIRKLPQLKSNIMQLDDSQLEKVFYSSINNGKAQNPTNSISSKNHQKANQSIKSVLNDKKGFSQQIKNGKLNSDNVHIFENHDERRQKKMRTIVLVHTEADYSDHEGEGPSKMHKVNNEYVRKCNCDCCKKLDVNQLMRRLAELLEEKK